MDDEVVDEEIEFASNDGDYVDAQVDEKDEDDGIEYGLNAKVQVGKDEVKEIIEISWEALGDAEIEETYEEDIEDEVDEEI